MSIQRYRTNHISGDYYPEQDGELVLYADHVAALAEAENAKTAHGYRMYDAGVSDERARIRAGVDALLPHYGKYDGWIMRDEALAAIDALNGES